MAKILVVEDEALVALDVCEALEKAGYEMLPPASDGDEARAALASQDVSLVIMDVRLRGGSDGIETAETLDAPVLYLTANSDPATVRRARGTRPYAFLSKPFDARALCTAVALALDRSANDAEREREIAAAKDTAARNGEVLATVSHELRNPITAISAWADFARFDPDPALREEALGVVARNARTLTRLVDDVMDSARASRGTLSMVPRPVDLAHISREVVGDVAPAAALSGVRLLVTGASGLIVDGDAVRLRQVVANLVGNAVKFTPAGKSVLVELRSDGGHVEAKVTDEGAGIEPAFLPHVFEPYAQGDSGRAARKGLGLGLALAKEIVAAHGGELTAASEGKGRGATFTVRLLAARS